jgi:hypothetical protein
MSRNNVTPEDAGVCGSRCDGPNVPDTLATNVASTNDNPVALMTLTRAEIVPVPRRTLRPDRMAGDPPRCHPICRESGDPCGLAGKCSVSPASSSDTRRSPVIEELGPGLAERLSRQSGNG